MSGIYNILLMKLLGLGDVDALLCVCMYVCMYTVNHKKGGSTFVTRLSGTNVTNFNKIHHMVSEQQLFKTSSSAIAERPRCRVC